MSAFIAIIHTDNEPVNSEILEKLTASLHFRGPDNQQTWIDGATGFGHALLSTTDEAQYESQPASLDNDVWITGSIRIDAREELIRKLGVHRQVRLACTPDSHLVLLAYEAWGDRCTEYLLGDFSFAIWDRRKQKLFCARDRFGMRQLVYARRKNALIVSNSIDCIRRHPLVSDRLCDQAIADFLLFGDHRWGSRAQTCFADIMALEPAHCFSVTAGMLKIRRYWRIDSDIDLLHYRKDSEYVHHFMDIFKACVCDRMRGKDLFISLSGGMGSSSVAATVLDLAQERKLPVNLSAATVLYDSIHTSDERQFVDTVSTCLKLPIHYIDGGKYPLLSPAVLTTSPIELYQPQLWLDLQRYAGKKSRVFLNGDGGDEILTFASVKDALKDMNIIRALVNVFYLKGHYGRYPPLGTGLKRTINKIFSPNGPSTTAYPFPGWINPELEHRLGLKDRWRQYWSRNSIDKPYRNPQIYQNILTPDWNTEDLYMNCGFTLPEQRSPFLDPRLVNFIVSLPALPWLFNKHLIRTAMRGKLPEKILLRPKTPLGFIHDSLIENADVESLDNGNRAKALYHYVDQSRLPVLHKNTSSGADSYINLRPLLLDRWLQMLSNEPGHTTLTSTATRLYGRN